MYFFSDFHEFDEEVFKDSVREALVSVQHVLDTDRCPNLRLAESVDHEYVDKYKLADLLTNTAIISFLVVLEGLGLTKEELLRLHNQHSKAPSRATTLRFASTESCEFVKQETVDVPVRGLQKETREVTTDTKDFGIDESTTTRSTIETIVNRVTRRHYTVETSWEVSVYTGTDVENRRVIGKRTNGRFGLCRDVPANAPSERSGPLQEEVSPPVELSLTWLLQHIDADEGKSHFAIDRSPENTLTKTPIRNPQIEQAVSFFHSAFDWAEGVHERFAVDYPMGVRSGDGDIDEAQQLGSIESLDSDAVFVPLLPLFEDTPDGEEGRIQNNENDDVQAGSNAILSLPIGGDGDGNGNESDRERNHSPMGSSPLLSVPDTTRFLNEQIRTLREVRNRLRQDYPDPETTTTLISSAEADVSVLCLHAQELASRYAASIDYIESMLKNQLVAAIGKKIYSSDIDKFMRYHNDKLMNPGPKPFCHTIRQPRRYPDGILSLEREVSGPRGTLEMEPISTHVRQVECVPPTTIPLNSATTVELTGETYLHGWLNHGFGDASSNPPMRLIARARQFSSFLLVVGTMGSQNRMHPKNAIILRNKDEVHIPLLLNEIPTATEFNDAIGSLSPEQQRFAKAFRSMQLESSVLGVCIIQIKPQLEKLLGLPRDSLAKEMKLTEDLTELFVEYQVPSDLLSYDGGSSESTKDQVASVKENVKSILDVIAQQKKEQLEQQTLKTDMAVERRMASESPELRSKMDRRLAEYERRFASEPRILCKKMAKSDTRNRGRMNSAIKCLKVVSDNPPPPPKQRELTYDDDCEPENITEIGCFGATLPSSSKNNTIDFTAIPKILDKAIELNDRDASIRSTTITTADHGWTKRRQPNLLSKPQQESFSTAEIASEKNKAIDLLDALSRSGSLEIPFSELHVVVCATHRFEKNVMATVIRDNINPIEKLEMSTLLMASTILGVPARHLVCSEKKCKQLSESFPELVKMVDADGSPSESPSGAPINGMEESTLVDKSVADEIF
ncbi:unnamed protein product [Pseudo-nitzschia multistriata]|uniref:Uncharacterized protein n=1 Tax=Pseudo-nitzschia multistriata TaxID=183589 RepID=A0A448YV46_9STRA|nr:unnamed protein product [Pseudo-nitzschia multistriata]